MGTGPGGAVLSWGQEAGCIKLDDLQFTLGQGAGLAAAETGAPVLVPDLAEAGARWPGFGPAAADLGVRAVFAFPLRIGAISVGAMLAHRGTPGPLAGWQLDDALALADALTVLLLHRQSAEAGHTDRSAPAGWAQPATYRAEVHQATGMVSVQLGVPLSEALVRLRAFAYGNDRLIAEVAAAVVARRLRFDETT